MTFWTPIKFNVCEVVQENAFVDRQIIIPFLTHCYSELNFASTQESLDVLVDSWKEIVDSSLIDFDNPNKLTIRKLNFYLFPLLINNCLSFSNNRGLISRISYFILHSFKVVFNFFTRIRELESCHIFSKADLEIESWPIAF